MKRLIPLLMLGLLVALTSCKGNAQDEIEASVSATQTKMAWEASVESAQQTEQADVPANEPEPSPEPVIVHTEFPADPSTAFNSYLTDFNSIDFADEGITYGDQFFMNRYERPFTVEMAEYRGYRDIIRADLDYNPPWFYLVVTLAEDLPESSGAVYSLELDLDVDGRGDFLIQAPQPASADWSVEGVQVLEDSNKDVGGELPQLTEELAEDQLGDGFDLVIFDSGAGDDPDLAWVRLDPEKPAVLQFAFKTDLTGDTGYLWSVWADEGLRDPSQRDYNDRYTFEDAGSPYPEHQYYPIQQINLLDSTCRSWYGFEPEGDEIGICQIYTKPSSGENTGWKVCVTYYGADEPITRCDSVCQAQCPAGIPYSFGSYSVSCQPCTLPD